MPSLRRGPLCLYAEPERRNSVPIKPERRLGLFSSQKRNRRVADFVEYLNICPDELFGL